LQDGMIFDTKGCDFDPAILTCSGAKNDSCLTPQQVGAIKRAFSGPKDSRGFQVYPGFPFDTGINAKTGIPGLLAPGPSPVGPPRNPTQQDVDQEPSPPRIPCRTLLRPTSAHSPVTAESCFFITGSAIHGFLHPTLWSITRK
jgi:Tannase and feruloyl esterase